MGNDKKTKLLEELAQLKYDLDSRIPTQAHGIAERKFIESAMRPKFRSLERLGVPRPEAVQWIVKYLESRNQVARALTARDERRTLMLNSATEWRDGLFYWKVVSNESKPVDYPFAAGFGCGSSLTVNAGQKISLQTQYQVGGSLNASIKAPGASLGASTSAQISETIVHEFSLSYAWTGTSGPCQYCQPRIYFPNASVRRLTRCFLKLRTFVATKTVFDPGDEYNIRSNCRHAPEECTGCPDAAPAQIGGGTTTGPTGGGITFIERVVINDRTPSPQSGRGTGDLRGIVTAGGDVGYPEQVAVHELAGRIRIIRPGEDYWSLYSIDEIDRALAAVRLNKEVTSLTLLGGTATDTYPTIEVEQSDGTRTTAEITGDVNLAGFRMLYATVELSGENMEQDEKATIRVGGGKPAQWPAVVV